MYFSNMAAHKSQSLVRFNFYVYARLFVDCHSFIYARKIYVRTHVLRNNGNPP